MLHRASYGPLWTRQWTFKFHKRRGIWLAEWLLSSEGLRHGRSKVLQRICGPTLHNEELPRCSSPHINTAVRSGRVTWEAHVERMGKMRNSYKISVWKPEGKRHLGKPRYRCEEIKRLRLHFTSYLGRHNADIVGEVEPQHSTAPGCLHLWLMWAQKPRSQQTSTSVQKINRTFPSASAILLTFWWHFHSKQYTNSE
jgi:hypothetical protein